MATIEMVLTSEEIKECVPYEFICQTRYSNIWNTTKRKRRWDAEFADVEKVNAEKVFKQTHNWLVGKGIPDAIRVDFPTYRLWNKIEAFCYSL